MRRTVRVSGDAIGDIENIYRYIAEHGGVTIADSVVDALERRIAQLSELSERGNYPKELAAVDNKEYRELHYKPYRIIYSIETNHVMILAVLDGRRDIAALLQRRLRL